MTDLELAKAFFERIQSKGFKLDFNKDAYGLRDNDESGPVVVELKNAEGESFVEFDFHSDGSFYRISGFTNGYWQDEVDWKKY